VVLACSAPVCADPIILEHHSSLFGGATIVNTPIKPDSTPLAIGSLNGSLLGETSATLSRALSLSAADLTTTASATIHHDTLSAQRFSGEGSVSAALSGTPGANIGGVASGDVDMFVFFQLLEPQAYVSTFTYSVDKGSSDFSRSEARLFSDVLGGFLFRDRLFSGSGTIVRSGILTPGLYALDGISSASARHCVEGCADGGMVSLASRSSFNLTFDLTPAVAPIPEPASIVLLGSGLLGLMTAARRRAKLR